MQTSYFKHYIGPGSISIARGSARWFKGPNYRPLNPGTWFKSVPESKYRELYFAQLSELDPNIVLSELISLAGEHEPILLCWESLKKPGEYCHRRMVAEWFQTELGLIIPEYPPENKPKKITVSQLALL